MNSLSDVRPKSVEKTSIPAATVPVELYVELPYWLMVPDCVQHVEVNGHEFLVDVRDNYVELYFNAVRDSKSTCLYVGPPQRLRPDVEKAIKKSKAPIMSRKCKTVLRIRSECDRNVILASRDKGQRKRSAQYYLQSFCEAHLDIVDRLIQQYRLATYDYFAHELSPWDVPIWFVASGTGFVRIVLQDYAEFDLRPYTLIEPSELQSALSAQPSAGEFELLDALNFMERGDYSDAVRRICTAIEAQTEFALRQELLKKHPLPDVEERLKASENDFPGRLRQYQKLSRRKLPHHLDRELKTTRELRRSIVHRGKRIGRNERGQAQKAVDTGRWIFNRIENEPDREAKRERTTGRRSIGKRSLGRHFSLYHAEITPTGVVVH